MSLHCTGTTATPASLLRLQLGYRKTTATITIHCAALRENYVPSTTAATPTLHYTTLEARLQLQLQLQYNYTTSSTTLKVHYTCGALRRRYNYNYTITHCLQPPFGPSGALLCHLCMATAHFVSLCLFTFLILETSATALRSGNSRWTLLMCLGLQIRSKSSASGALVYQPARTLEKHSARDMSHWSGLHTRSLSSDLVICQGPEDDKVDDREVSMAGPLCFTCAF